ncbi:M20/M25/M40 family metallo-hydrolase [Caulobacter endophyticus]|uniref:M20/M25/M40 family metallo-hydrolase n=1 Tax=Caulobacter endophyticus TaxID=2172652 RepID=UPI0024109E80|nr:M20/M25/M40 family metallo-hydrolase [Caulobacter endophyticus]MDG2530770.1 M20/M25/M40 family metallo-hydrolase [Caulobacter endophyticus]
MRMTLAAVAAAVLAGLAAPALAGPGDLALDDVKTLSADAMQGRAPGTPGSQLARTYILERFKLIGLAPIGEGFEQPFRFTRKDGTTITGVNLVARIKGRAPDGKALVVTAHYDHVGVKNGQIYNGADDNASGVAGLLAVAEAFKVKPPKHDVLIVALDAEEGGLRGAKAFVAQPPIPLSAIGLNVNFDMLSKNAKGELYAAGAAPQPALKPILEAVARTAPVKLKLGHDTDAEGKESNWTTQSDHGAFAEKGVPWVYFGVEDHPEYHQPTDDFETIPQAFFQASVATVIQATRAFDERLGDVAR